MNYNIQIYPDPRYKIYRATGERVFLIDEEEVKMCIGYMGEIEEECIKYITHKLDSLTIEDCIEQQNKQIEQRKVYDRKYKWYKSRGREEEFYDRYGI